MLAIRSPSSTVTGPWTSLTQTGAGRQFQRPNNLIFKLIAKFIRILEGIQVSYKKQGCSRDQYSISCDGRVPQGPLFQDGLFLRIITVPPGLSILRTASFLRPSLQMGLV
jgi:hypothetical protein